MSFYFADKTWPEIKKFIQKNAVILIPIGTIEEHGPHLGVGADAMIAEDITNALGNRLEKEKKFPFLVLPTLWSGYSQKVMTEWPGTIRIRPKILIDLIFDITSSLIDMGFRRVVWISTHGHHDGVLRVAMREISDTYEIYPVVIFPSVFLGSDFQKIRKSKPGGAIHAGEYETSLMMYFNRPVKEKAIKKEDMPYHTWFYPGDNFTYGSKVFWSTWGIHKSKSGIYGNPKVASPATGGKILDIILNRCVLFLEEFVRKTAKKLHTRERKGDKK